MRPIVRDDLADFRRQVRSGMSRLGAKIDRLAAHMVGMEARMEARMTARLAAELSPIRADISVMKAQLEESLALHRDQERANRFFDYKIRHYDEDLAALKRRCGYPPEAA